MKNIKLISIVITLLLIMIAFVGCGNSGQSDGGNENMSTPSASEQLDNGNERVTNPDASEIFNGIDSVIPHMSKIIVYTEETDPNGNLGRPGNYISKADFCDDRTDSWTDWETDEVKMGGGTIETFSSKEHCDSRYNYLIKFLDAEMGAFGLNQYAYKYDTVIFRVDHELTPSQALEYEKAVSVFLGKEPLETM